MALISGMNFVVDFSGVSWMTAKNLALSAALSTADSDSLLSLLGMDQFLYDAPNQCVRTDAKYTPSTNGWKNGVLPVYVIEITNLNSTPSQFFVLC